MFSIQLFDPSNAMPSFNCGNRKFKICDPKGFDLGREQSYRFLRGTVRHIPTSAQSRKRDSTKCTGYTYVEIATVQLTSSFAEQDGSPTLGIRHSVERDSQTFLPFSSIALP